MSAAPKSRLTMGDYHKALSDWATDCPYDGNRTEATVECAIIDGATNSMTNCPNYGNRTEATVECAIIDGATNNIQ